EGVGCEACHGPGGDYLHKHYAANPDEQALAAMGFRKFSDLRERDNMCRACHNELSPTYKPFNVEAFSDAIRHWASEYIIEVPDEAPTEIVIKAPEPVKVPTIDVIAKATEEKKLYDQTDYFKKLVAEEKKQPEAKPEPTPTPQVPKPQTPPRSSSQSSGDARLNRIPKDWMLGLNGPKRGPVFFPHQLHLAGAVTVEREAEVCIVCHHTSQAGATMTNCSDGACHKFEPTAAPSREKAFHANCRSCHREEDAGPQKCRECHNG
ncbi:hypothetical protein MJD09_12040, partial [bacterium]|nr:hypothetical protein [bacterium]